MIRNGTVNALYEEIHAAIEATQLVEDEVAARLARAVLLQLQRRHGGGNVYVPVDYARAYPLEEILRAYAGDEPVKSICRRFNLSRSVFYRLVGFR